MVNSNQDFLWRLLFHIYLKVLIDPTTKNVFKQSIRAHAVERPEKCVFSSIGLDPKFFHRRTEKGGDIIQSYEKSGYGHNRLFKRRFGRNVYTTLNEN